MCRIRLPAANMLEDDINMRTDKATQSQGQGVIGEDLSAPRFTTGN